MKFCVLFYNLGGYHLARLRAAKSICDQRGIEFCAVEIAGSTSEHPWGKIERPDYVTTLFEHRDDPKPTVVDAGLFRRTLEHLKPAALAIPGWGFDFSRIAIDWGKRNKCQLILMSESKKDDAPRNFLKEQIKKHLWVKKFDAALVGGQKHIDYLVSLGMSRDRIFTGYNVVDNDFFSSRVKEIRASWKASGARPDFLPSNRFFLAANRFIERKNLPRLVEGFAQAMNGEETEEPWDLVLLGAGCQGETRKIHDAIANSGLSERIHLPGFVQYDQIGHWYAAASAFVHPALSEQWGLVVNEAMASSLPILLSNACGCHPDLIDEGLNGFSFDPTNAKDIANKLKQITSVDTDKMGVASKRQIDKKFPTTCFGKGLTNALDVVTKP